MESRGGMVSDERDLIAVYGNRGRSLFGGKAPKQPRRSVRRRRPEFSNATKALKAVSGVDDADVSLENGEAVIMGSADADALIAAVKAAGYDAELAG